MNTVLNSLQQPQTLMHQAVWGQMVAFHGCLLVALSLVCGIAMAQHHDQLLVALDNYIGRSPQVALQPASAKLLHFQILTPSESVDSELDIVVAAEWSQIFRIFSVTKSTFHQSQFGNRPEIITLFEDKARWKSWMNSIGLGMFIPESYVYRGLDTTGLKFPMVLKTNWTGGQDLHSGHGVHIIRSTEQLHKLARKISSKRASFFLEESLTGMGLAEMSSFGSVLKGKVLSMRCMIRSYSPEKIVRSKYNVHFNESAGGPYIKGPTLKFDEDVPLPCGSVLVGVVTKMFANTDYTGLYCTNWKLDAQQRPKMMEVNARFCGTLSTANGDALLLSSLVPLGYAVLSAVGSNNTAYQHRSALLHSPHRAIYERILSEEQRALATGGGWYQNAWHNVSAFDMQKRLDPILVSYGLS